MGKLIDGKWVGSEEQTRISQGGDFVRGRTKFREWVRRRDDRFPPESGRYHLWVAHNCPWAHRAIIVRNLKRLTSVIGMTVAHFRRDEDGWWFHEGLDDFSASNDKFPLHVLYAHAGPDYTGSATVPVLWDRKQKTIVSNESGEVIKMLNSEFDDCGGDSSVDLYPEDDREDIEEVNAWVYEKINNGVYRCGFARTQEAYERAFFPLFEGLDEADLRLSKHRYLVGDRITLADIRLFTTLSRFDAVYFSHFKCNLRRVSDYPNLGPYMRDMFQTKGIGETVRIDLYKKGYYGRSPGLNPRGIIPVGPALDFEAPHDRDRRY